MADVYDDQGNLVSSEVYDDSGSLITSGKSSPKQESQITAESPSFFDRAKQFGSDAFDWLGTSFLPSSIDETDPQNETYIGANTPIIKDIYPGGMRIPHIQDIYEELIRPVVSPLGLGIMGLESAIGYRGKSMANQPEPYTSRLGLKEPSNINLKAEGYKLQTQPLRLNPASESVLNPPRFLSGEAGLADVTQPHVIDTAPVKPRLGVHPAYQGTILPRELGELNQIPADLAARRGLSLGEIAPVSAEDRLLRSIEKTSNELRGNVGRPDLPAQLPSAIKLVPKVVAEVETNPVAKSVVKTALEAESETPEISAAATSPEFIDKYVKPVTRNTSTKRAAASLGSSIDTELSKQNPLLGEVVKKVQTDSAIQAGTWTVQWDKIVNHLSADDQGKLVKAIEGKYKPSPTEIKLTKALNEYKQLDAEISSRASESGMGLKSSDGNKLIPWEPRDNYWPHLYTDEFFTTLKNNPNEFRAQMMKSGMSPFEIDGLLKNSKRFGERLIDAQHGREANLPGYRVDANVYREHISDMARRITEAEHYGPMDLADLDSPLMNLIKETSNPKYSEDLMKKLLNRDVHPNSDFQDVTRKAMGLQAWLHLGTAALSNPATIAMPAIQTNTSSFVRGLANTIFQSQKTGEFAESAGAINNIFRQVFAQAAKGHEWGPTKLYGLDAEERFMRTISAETGRAYAKQLFSELKKNPNNPAASKQLRNLILEEIPVVLKQPELTEFQTKRAAFRTAELSQGLADKQNLPAAWTGSGVANLLTLFHKYQFAQTKIMKDMIKANPVRATIMLGVMSQIAGEITGDTKATVRGGIKAAWSNDSDKIEEEIANRGKFMEDKFGMSPTMARIAENATQSFMLGVFSDVIESMGGTGTDALKTLAGSAVGDLIKLFDIGKNAGLGSLNAIQGEEAPQLNKAVTGATSLLPIIGPPIASEMKLNQ